MRADQYLAKTFGSRSRAADAIKKGQVRVNGKTISKPAFDIADTDVVETDPGDAFASRGAYKLLDCIAGVDLKGKVVLDIGASTGGFTDVCLRKGARKVFALDVGHDQLRPELKSDPRVVNWEGTDARDLRADWFDQPVDFICMDVSFISARTILEHVFGQFVPDAAAVLVKPQFECGRQHLNRNNIVKDAKVRKKCFADMQHWLEQWYRTVTIREDIPAGRSGNQEAMLVATEKRETND